MQGYFSYVLYGAKEQIENVIERVEKLAETNEDFECINKFSGGIEESSGEYCVKYEMSESGNVGFVTFLFEDMMSDLVKEFSELYIEGTGNYLNDYGVIPTWISGIGDSSFETTYVEIDKEIEFNMENILDENGKFKECTIEFTCDVCEGDIELKITEDNIVYDGEEIDYIDKIETKCSWCDTEYSVSFETTYAEIDKEIEFNMENILDENGKFKECTIEFTCDVCEGDIELKITEDNIVYDGEEIDYIDIIETKCSWCDTEYSVRIEPEY